MNPARSLIKGTVVLRALVLAAILSALLFIAFAMVVAISGVVL